MPRTTQPYVGDVDALARTYDVVLEHIAPLRIGSVAWRNDVAAARTVNLQGVAVQIDVTVVVDEVNCSLDE